MTHDTRRLRTVPAGMLGLTMSPSVVLRSRGALLLAGVGSELIYLLYFVRQFPLLPYSHQDLDMGDISNHSHAAFWGFVYSFTVLFLLLGIAYWSGQDWHDRTTLWIILAMGAMFAITLTFVYPITAIDIFTYINQSRIMLHYHQNPIFVAPSHFPFDPLMPLSDGWRDKGAPYGPLGIVINALSTIVAGDNLLENLILIKLLYSAMALGCAYLVHQILGRVAPRYALGGALLVAWNPLVLFEISVNGHNDAAMMLIALIAIQSMVEAEFAVATIALVLSALVKYGTALLLPLFVVHALAHLPTTQRRIRYLVLAGAGSLLATVALYAPFWEGPSTLNRSLLENDMHIESFSSVLPTVFGGGITVDAAGVIGRVLFVPLYAYALWLARGEVADLLRGCFLAVFGFLALGVSNFKIWYAVWPSILAGAIPNATQRLAAQLLAYGATISATFYAYVWVWNDLQNFSDVNIRAYLLTFAPAALALAVLSFRRRAVGEAPSDHPTA